MKIKLPTQLPAPSLPDSKLLQQLAAKGKPSNKTIDKVFKFARALESKSGLPLKTEIDVPGLRTDSELESAWTAQPARNEHTIRIGPVPDWLRPHFFASELIKLEMELLNIDGHCLKRPAINAPSLAAIRGVKARSSKDPSYPGRLENLGKNLAAAAYEMMVRERLLKKFPELSATQKYLAIYGQFDRSFLVMKLSDPGSSIPRALREAHIALHVAAAIHADQHFGDTALSDNYRLLPQWPVAQKIVATYKRYAKDPQPGDEYRLIGEMAAIVGFPKLIQWHTITASLPTTNPETQPPSTPGTGLEIE